MRSTDFNAKAVMGERAPDFELIDQYGQPFRLSSLLGQQPIVLFFYPKDGTPVCTAQVCGFRDHYASFQSAGAAVIGISQDSQTSHKSVTETLSVPFTLLSDDGSAVAKQYEVSSLFGMLPGRVTFIIDRQGLIIHRFSALLQADPHIDEALKILQTLSPT